MKIKLSHAALFIVTAIVLTVYVCRGWHGSIRPTEGRPIIGVLNVVKDTSGDGGYVTVLRMTIFDGENNFDFVKEVDPLVGKRVVLRVVGE